MNVKKAVIYVLTQQIVLIQKAHISVHVGMVIVVMVLFVSKSTNAKKMPTTAKGLPTVKIQLDHIHANVSLAMKEMV